MIGEGVTAMMLTEFALSERAISSILNTVGQWYNGYKLIEITSMKLKIQIPKWVQGRLVSFGELFRFSEDMKTKRCIADYSICETTLEHIFQYFANQDGSLFGSY